MEKILNIPFKNLAKDYLKLAKPGIIMGNLVTAVGGFILAAKASFSFELFLCMLTGLSLIIGSGCALNNYIDRHADGQMQRTQNRPLVKKTISAKNALIFATILGTFGVFLLAYYVNLLTAAVAICGFIVYVLFYSFLKYRTVHATLIGSIAGAVPPVVGYCAISHRLDLGALILFLMVVLWQMPHFFAIAIYRIEEYKAAHVPVLPLVKGMRRTKIQMFFYVVAFILSCLALTFFQYTGYFFALTAALLGVIWLWLGIQGFKTEDHQLWARKMFFFSLVIITLLCTAIPFSLA